MSIGKAGSFQDPIGQVSVVDQVVERIRDSLLSRELRPGDLLPTEAELVERLGVSKTSVREAIKMLQAHGIVEVRRGRGTKISENIGSNLITPLIYQLLLNRGSIQEILDFRRMFEEAYSVMAMENATEEDLARIKMTIANLELAIAEKRQTSEDDLAFHLEVLRSTHNQLVIRVGETIMDLFRVAIGFAVEEKAENILQQHKNIYSALCLRDEQALRQAIKGSFEPLECGLETQLIAHQDLKKAQKN